MVQDQRACQLQENIETLQPQEVTILRLLSQSMYELPKLAQLFADRPVFAGVDIGVILSGLEARGYVEYFEPEMWLITDDGKARFRSCLQQRRKDLLPLIQEKFDRFNDLDHRIKEVCSSWQTKPEGKANRHDDPAYDLSLVAALTEVNQQIKTLLSGGGLEKEFELLADLDEALAKVKQGEVEYYTGLWVSSYHNVWRELHEDILATLGLERED